MAIDWTKSMDQSYEFYEIDPGTWKEKRRLTEILTCSINWDYQAETLGSATIDTTEALGECYVRVYMIVIQNGVRYKIPLGVFLVQTPSETFDGMMKSYSLDAYTPLMELKEDLPPLGFTVMKGIDVVNKAANLCSEHMRAPIVIPSKTTTTLYDNFVANTDDTWLSYISDLLRQANYSIELDELGQVMFAPYQDTASLQPVWTYDDSNSSILLPNISLERDLYGIPNVVEVYCSSGTGGSMYSKVVNDDKDSPISTVNRGRVILHRDTNPSIGGNPTQEMVDEYATQLLRSLSTLEYTVNYTHGYAPVRIGDCVRLNYTRAGLVNVKARVISQSFKCETGCVVSEKAVYTNKLWR